MALGLAVFQINTLLDSLIAWTLSPKAGTEQVIHTLGWQVACPLLPGSVTGLQLAQRLYQFPLGVFGVALSTAIFPALSRAAAAMVNNTAGYKSGENEGLSQRGPRHVSDTDGLGAHGHVTQGVETVSNVLKDHSEFRHILRAGLRLTMFVGLPASVGLILVRVPLSRLMFERYEFTTNDAIRVADILAGYACAVWAYSMTHVITRAFYALGDARTPVRVSLVMVAVNVFMNLTLVWPLGAAGLAWSTAVCAMIQTGLLLRTLGKQVDNPMDRDVWLSWGRSAMLSLIMAGVLSMVMMLYDPQQLSRSAIAVLLGGVVTLGIAIVGIVAKMIGAVEINWLIKRRVETSSH